MASDSTPAWEVTGQVETVAVGPTGNYTAGVQVSFRLPSGTIGSVFIPQDAYTPARVRDAVAAKAADMTAVDQLSG